MANFGLSKPYIAKYDMATDKYSDCIKCGKAINTSVTPNYSSGSLYADDIESEHVDEFTNANVTLGVDELPAKAGEIVFGHKIDEDGTEISNSNDSSNYIGYGFMTTLVIDGIKKYQACVILKVKFTEGENSYETKGGNITFKNPTLSGTATPINNGDWRKKSKKFNTAEEAEKYIQDILGYKAGSTDGTESAAGTNA